MKKQALAIAAPSKIQKALLICAALFCIHLSTSPAILWAQEAKAKKASIEEISKAYLKGEQKHLKAIAEMGLSYFPKLRALAKSDSEKAQLLRVAKLLAKKTLDERIKLEGGLIYAGQFEALLPLGEEGALALLEIFTNENLLREVRTRAAIGVGDLRSTIGKDALAFITKKSNELIEDYLSETWCATEACYLLARLGDQSCIEGRIVEYRKTVSKEPTAAKIQEHLEAHTELAEVFYRSEQYLLAIKHYQQKRAILADILTKLRTEFRQSIAEEIALLNYNLACSQSLAKKYDDCFASLEQALPFPNVTIDMVQRDGDLRGLRKQKEFAAFLAKWNKKVQGE